MLSSIPEGDVPAPYLLRDATEEDIPLLQALYAQSIQGQMVAAHIGEDWWRYQVTHWQASRSGEHWLGLGDIWLLLRCARYKRMGSVYQHAQALAE